VTKTEIKNPYSIETPEWQLFANMQSKYLQALASQADADRATRKVDEATRGGALYAEALAKLDPNFINPYAPN